jgi:tetratricopeptide (TPR) repeat protein
VKFVVILSVGVVALLSAVAGTLYFVAQRSPEELMRLGEAKMAAGDYTQAEKFFSRGVNKDQSNPKNQERWREALMRLTPATRVEYEQKFQMLDAVTRTYARTKRTDLDAHRLFIGSMVERAKWGGASRALAEGIKSSAEDALAYFDDKKGQPGPWDMLRGYRGIGVVMLMVSGGDVSEQQIADAKTDLEAAMAADPRNTEAAVYLEQWHAWHAEKAMEKQQLPEAGKHMADGLATLESFIAANPDDAAALGAMLVRKLETEQFRLSRESDREKRVAGARQMADQLAGTLDRLGTALLKSAPTAFDPHTTDRLMRIERLVAPQDRMKRAEAVLRAALGSRPTDTDALMMLGSLLSDTQRHDEAIKTFQAVIDAPQIPVSFAGFRQYSYRIEAPFQQAQAAVKKWDGAENEEARKAALADVRKYRDALGQVEPPTSPKLRLVDGQLAFAQNDFGAAQKAVAEYNQATRDSNVDAVWLSGRIADRLNQPGVARERFERVLQLGAASPQVILAISEIEARLQNFDRAIDLLQTVREVAPDFPGVEERLRTIRAMTAQGGARPTDSDPVVAMLRQADDLFRQAKFEDARKLLETNFASSGANPQIATVYARLLTRLNEKDKAVQVLRDSLAKHPGDQQVQDLLTAVTATDPVEARIAIINSRTNEPEIERLLASHEVYRRAALAVEESQRTEREKGWLAKADAVLAQAAKLAPDDQRVLEFRFIDAIEKKDFAAARTLSDEAVKRDIDRVGGRTFQARLAVAENRPEEASRLVREAAAGNTLTPEGWRLVGRLNVQLNRAEDALAAYRRALEMRPDDVEAITEVLAGLVTVGRLDEALTFARNSRRFAEGSGRFVEAWLSLEEDRGDKGLALQQRQQTLALNPTDRAARAAVSRLLIAQRTFPEAQKSIDELNKLGPGLDAVELQARWHADQGDIEAAKRAFDQYIASIPADKASAEPHLTKAQFLLGRPGQIDAAIAALIAGRPVQDPKVLPIERALGDIYARLGRGDLAVEPLEKVVASGNDTPDALFAKRLVEAYMGLGRWDDADKAMKGLMPREATDPAVSMLRSDLARGRGDQKAAREILDQAVGKFPQSAPIYLRRAQLMKDRPEQQRDMLADIEQSLRLAPNLYQSLLFRAQHWRGQGRLDDYFNDVRAALRINPLLDDARNEVLDVLLDAGRDADATSFAAELARLRPSDATLQGAIGDRFLARGRWTMALPFIKVAYESTRTLPATYRYLDCLLNATPPQLNEAEAVLRAVQDKIDTDAALLISRAKLLAGRGRGEQARADLAASLRSLRVDQGPQVQTWLREAQRVVTDRNDLVRIMESVERETKVPEWVRLIRAAFLTEDDRRRAEALPIFEELSKSATSELVLAASIRLRGSTLYRLGQHEKAVEVFGEGLKKFPTDWELNNNMAFTLSKHLNRAADALKFAEQAVKTSPNNPDSMDTLGWTQHALGKFEEAEATLRRALSIAQDPRTRVTILTHLGTTLLERKNNTEARALAEEAQKLLPSVRPPDADQKAELEALQRRIDAL